MVYTFEKPENFKPFSQASYDANQVFEEKVRQKLSIENHTIIKNPNKHGIDLLVIRNSDGEVVGGIEVENRSGRWSDGFKPSEVIVYGRKVKYNKKNYFIIILSREMLNCCMKLLPEIFEYPVTQRDTFYVKNEYVFVTPPDSWIWGWNNVIEYLNMWFNKEVKNET